MIAVKSTIPRESALRIPPRALLALLLGLLLLLWPGAGRAQTAPSLTMTLCQGSACGLASVAPGAALYYKLTLTSTSSAPSTVSILDMLPAGFQLAGYGCAATVGAGTPQTASTAQPLIIPSITINPGAQWQCAIFGTFGPGAVNGASNTAQLVDPLNTQTVLRTSNVVNASLDPTKPLPSNLSITKIASTSLADITLGPQSVTYTLTIANNGPEDVYLGHLMTVEDRVALGPQSVVVDARFQSATCAVVPTGGSGPPSACLAPIPVYSAAMPVRVSSAAQVPFVRWGYPPGSAGLLRAGHKIVLSMMVELSRVPGVTCILAPNSDRIDNHAYVVLTLPSAVLGGPITTISDPNAADNRMQVGVPFQTGATVINPACNLPYLPPSDVLSVTKIQMTPAPTSLVSWSHPFVHYKVTVRNISNIPGLRIRNIQVEDWVTEGVETPSFTATLLAHACSPPCANVVGTSGPQLFNGNSDTRRMYQARLVPMTSGGLLYNQTASFTVRLRYRNPGCDGFPAINPKRIYNAGIVLSWDQAVGTSVTAVNQVVGGAVATPMRPVPPCPLIVEKTTTGPEVLFSNSSMTSTTNYNIVYRNPTGQTYVMNTLGDMMRIRPPLPGLTPYALELRVDYSYNCSNTQGSVTGFPATNPLGPSGVDTALVVETQLPQQGVRLIRNLQPVVFGPYSKLQCSLFTWIYPPAAGDPHCSRGELENAALLDPSRFYDPNTDWATSSPPGMYASAVRNLPRCFHLVVNKEASEAWTWQGGGPLNWTLRVTNFGPPIIAPGPQVSDTIASGVPATSSNSQCVPAGCAFAWNPPPTAANPSSLLAINGLGTGQEIVTTIGLAYAPASIGPGGEVCNLATARMSPFVMPPNNNYYWKTRVTLSSRACIPVLETATLTVRKRVNNNTGLPIPSPFTIEVKCTNPNPAFTVPDTVLTLAANTSGTVQNIPVGSSCTAAEVPLPTAPAGTAACPNPMWAITYLPPGPIAIISGGATVTVGNVLTCSAPGSLHLTKTTAFPPGMPPAFASVLVDVSCTPSGPVTTVSVPANGAATLANLPAPATCTVTEQVPQSTVPGCTWSAVQPGPVGVAPGAVALATISNLWTCASGGDATLIVTKYVLVNGSQVPASPSTLPTPWQTSFPISITCGGNAPISGSLSASNNYTAYIAVPVGIPCTVQETTPVFPSPNCHWSTTYPGGATATLPMTGGSATVIVHNRQVCS